MLSQFKNYTQTKKNPVLGVRPSVFCSPDEDEDEDLDYSQYLDMKGNLVPLLPVAVAAAIFGDLVLTRCLKSLHQRTQTPDLLSRRWPLSWQKVGPN